MIQVEEILALMRSCVRQINQTDLRLYEEEVTPLNIHELTTVVLECLGVAQRVLEELSWRYERKFYEHLDGGDEFYRQMDALVFADEERSQQLADMAFLAYGEVARRREMLEQVCLTDADRWELIAHCDRCLGVVSKALTALEIALCGHLQITPTLKFVAELTIALEIRRVYQKLYREIDETDPPTSLEYTKPIRFAGASLAKLIGRDIYPWLRASDRYSLRQLQHRIIGWLSNSEKRNFRSGMQLWQDITSFVELLRQINHRTELIEHDRRVIYDAYIFLIDNPEPPVQLPPDWNIRMQTLCGLDLELDQLLGSGDFAQTSQLKPVIGRLYEELIEESSFSPDYPSIAFSRGSGLF